MGKFVADSENRSFFDFFWELSETLAERHPKLHSIGLSSLTESMALFFSAKGGESAIVLQTALAEDYSMGGKRYVPPFLRAFWTPPSGLGSVGHSASTKDIGRMTPQRQQRHQEN